MNNKLLKIALVVSRIIKVLLFAMIFLVVAMCAYLIVAADGTTPEWITATETGMSLGTDATDGIGDLDVNPWGLVVNALLIIAKLILILVIMEQVIKIIESIKSLETFHETNVLSFMTIGHMFIGIFLIGILGIRFTDSGFHLSFHLNLIPLLGTLAAYIMAEVFKEGHRLMEENKLTI